MTFNEVVGNGRSRPSGGGKGRKGRQKPDARVRVLE